MNNDIKPSFVQRLIHNGDAAPSPDEGLPVGAEQAREWARILQEYKSSRVHLEQRIVENQRYWQLIHWRQKRKPDSAEPEPTSAWLTNVILSKHAARMDAYPEVSVLAREQSDEAEAQMLTSIVPSVLDRCGFRKVYSRVGWDKQISCAGAYCITWDPTKYNGLGDINVSAIDLLNLFWEPGIDNIQDSRYVFAVKLVDRDILVSQYPQQLADFRGGASSILKPTEYTYEDNAKTDGKEVVVDVYYHKSVNGKPTLQFAKFVQDRVLYATENDTQPRQDPATGQPIEPMAVRGLYDHGKYPFVIEPLYPIKGSIAGFGYVDICKDPQRYIDIMGGAMLKNVMDNATPRYFVRSDAGINKAQFNDLTQRIIDCTGNLGQDSVRPTDQRSLQGGVLSFYQYKIDEMKQTAGNRDASNGGAEGGVTAASALAIQQEAGNNLSRDENDTAYDAFKDVITICIELIRQFYDLPRSFRIMGDNGAAYYIAYSNARIRMQTTVGVDKQEYFRVPEFDLDVEIAREEDYSRQSQNNLALQFYQAGFFNPAAAQMALACLQMMEFKNKDKLVNTITNMAQMYQMAALQQAQQTGGQAARQQGGGYDAQKQADRKQAEAAQRSQAGVTP